MARTRRELVAQYLRLFLLIVNALTAVLSLVAFIVAIVLSVSSQYVYEILTFGILRPTDLLLPTTIVVVIGIVLGVFGVVLAKKRPGKILLTVHGIILGFVLLIFFSAAIFYWAVAPQYTSDIPGAANVTLQHTNASDPHSQDYLSAWNKVQIEESCCGVQSLKDWYTVHFPGKNDSYPNSVPPSCCDLSKWSPSSPCTGVDVTAAEVDQKKYFSQGCSGVIQNRYLYFTNITSSFAFICSILMCISVVLTVAIVLLLKDNLLDYETYDQI